eukprot:Gb_40498 [translate_table: standard]
MLLFESEVFEGILRFDGRKLEEVSGHHQLQPTKVAWKATSLVTEFHKVAHSMMKACLSEQCEELLRFRRCSSNVGDIATLLENMT